MAQKQWHRVDDPPYIKLDVSIGNVLARLKGAPLSAFMSLAFNEAAIGLGQGKPLSVYEIAERTDFSPRSIRRAVQHLIRHRFALQMPERGSRGETLYRVARCASFGRATPIDPASHNGNQPSPAYDRKRRV